MSVGARNDVRFAVGAAVHHMHTLSTLITEPGLATALFSNAREGIVVTDVQGRIVEVNPALDRRNATARLAVDLVESLFGKSTLMRD